MDQCLFRIDFFPEASVLPVIAGSLAAGCIFVFIIAGIITLRVKR